MARCQHMFRQLVVLWTMTVNCLDSPRHLRHQSAHCLALKSRASKFDSLHDDHDIFMLVSNVGC